MREDKIETGIKVNVVNKESILVVTGVHVVEAEFGKDVVKYFKEKAEHDPNKIIMYNVKENKNSSCKNLKAQKRAYEEVQKQIDKIKPGLFIDLHHGFSNNDDYRFIIITNQLSKWKHLERGEIYENGCISVYNDPGEGVTMDMRGDELLMLPEGVGKIELEVILDSYYEMNDLFRWSLQPSDLKMKDFLKKGEVYEKEARETALLLKRICNEYCNK